MEIATIICVHAHPDLARDTIDSVRAWVTQKILLVVDKSGWRHYADFNHPDTIVICGEYHRANKSPYKNMAIGLREAYQRWPDMDWYNWFEYDAVYLNDYFKIDLAKHSQAACAGFSCVHKYCSNDHWLVKEILEEPNLECFKMLGAVTFYANKCIRPLAEYGFFDEVVKRTQTYKGDQFPRFGDYAVEEVIYPSAASLFGEVESLANLSEKSAQNRYAVRYGQTIMPHEVTPETSIVHPSKHSECKIRTHYMKGRHAFI